MKKLISIFSLLFLIHPSFAQEQTIQVTPVVQSAVIYLDGAELYQKKEITLNAGRTQITFNGISSKVISKSIQVTASGDVNILSVTDKLNYIDAVQNSPKTKVIRDSINLLDENTTILQNDKEAYETEKTMLSKNQSIGGQDKGVSIVELKLAADFYRSRIKEINNEIYKIDKKINSYNESINQLIEINGAPKGPTAEISVLVASAAKQVITLDLKYLVSDAGWAPSYDIVTEDVNKPITLKYRAKVYNNTDVDWKNIKIKLSTGDPMKNASKPELEDWYLNFNTLNYANNSAKGKFAQSSLSQQNLLNTRGGRSGNEGYYQDGDFAAQNSIPKIEAKNIEYKAQEQKVALEEIEISDLSAEFDIKTEYTIPSDAKPYIIDVTTYNLPASYKYFSIPKADKSAFMLARISGWEELELVTGPANVYLGGTYVGQSYINTKSTNDTLDLSVGRDNKIMVSRTQLKDFNTEKVIGNNKKSTYSYEIVVKNNRKSPITIDVEDQVPVSQSSDITVETIELSKGELNPLTGKIKWKLTIEPGEAKKINLAFSIKYPRNKSLQLKKYRTISAPSF
jgi:uncharacterized protein (TIGR02231 family)